MASKQRINQLYVYMNGIHVGMLTREASRYYSFSYDQDWLQRDNARPISLSMPLTQTTFKGDAVYNYFDNLLPDSELIRERIQTRFQTPTHTCFDLLSHIGSDCVGALQLLTQPITLSPQKIQANPIDNQSIAIIIGMPCNGVIG